MYVGQEVNLMYKLTLRIGEAEQCFSFPGYDSACVAAAALAMFTTSWTRHSSVCGPVSHGGYYADLYNEGSIIITRDESVPEKRIWVKLSEHVRDDGFNNRLYTYYIGFESETGYKYTYKLTAEAAAYLFDAFKKAGYTRINV